MGGRQTQGTKEQKDRRPSEERAGEMKRQRPDREVWGHQGADGRAKVPAVRWKAGSAWGSASGHPGLGSEL